MRHDEFIYLYSHHLPKPDNNLAANPIVIEDDAWIGFNCTILKGVKIGKGAIIGACSVVTSDVPPHSVIVGNPPRTVKFTN
jgi:maltose O-acetyltransferase